MRGVVALALVVVLASPTLASTEPLSIAPPAVYLPNVTKTLGGVAGWTTPVAMQNVGSVSTQVSLELYRFSDGAQVATLLSPSLQPGQAWVFDPLAFDSVPADTQFSLVLRPTSAPVSAVVLEGKDGSAMAYSGTTSGASSLYLPNVTRRLGGPDGWETPFIVQNLGTTPTMVSVSFYAFADGTLVRRLDGISIAPGRSQAFVPFTIEGLRDDAQYSVVVEGERGAQLHAIVNEHQGDQAMSYSGQQFGSSSLYLPIVMRGADGWDSPFIIQNVGSEATTFVLAFLPVGVSQPVATTPEISVLPGRAYPVDVRFEPAGLAPGRYSVFVGGAVGARLVAIVNQHATGKAMAYEGFAHGDVTAALPYVTKNSGPARWSSRIFATNLWAGSPITITLVRSGGATAATRTFYGVGQAVTVAYDLAADPSLPDGVYSALVRADQRVVAVVDHVGIGPGDLALSYGSTPAGPVTPPIPPPPTASPSTPTRPPTPAPTLAPTPTPPPSATPPMSP